MRMLLEIARAPAPDKRRGSSARSWPPGFKIPGFGQPRESARRIARDPPCGRLLGIWTAAGQPIWYEMSQRSKALVKGGQELNPNVDFYSASTYTRARIDIDLFTRSRSAACRWTAHVSTVPPTTGDPHARRIHSGRSTRRRTKPLEAR